MFTRRTTFPLKDDSGKELPSIAVNEKSNAEVDVDANTMVFCPINIANERIKVLRHFRE